MKTFKCPLCNGKGESTAQQLEKYLNRSEGYRKLLKENKKLRAQDFSKRVNISKLIEKTKLDEKLKWEKKTVDIAIPLNRKIKEQVAENEELKKLVEKLTAEKKTPREQGDMNVKDFVSRLETLYKKDTEDEFIVPENSRPDVMHIIKHDGEVLGRWIYELKDRKFLPKDISQLKRIAEEYKASGRLLIVKELPKTANGSHIKTIENVFVVQFHTAIPLTRIMRDMWVSQRITYGKTIDETIKSINGFFDKHQTIINNIGELAATLDGRKKETQEFNKKCKQHINKSRDFENQDENTLEILRQLLTGMKRSRLEDSKKIEVKRHTRKVLSKKENHLLLNKKK